MAESKIIFYEGTQEEYDSSSRDENGIYFITDSKAIYKGSVKYSGESEIATPASPGVIRPGESFEVSSDGTLNLVDIPDTLFTPVKEEMKTEINKAVSESGHLKREVVDSLPLSGIDNVIYMKSKSGEEDNIYDEYMWINQKWERIGSSEVDLSNYPTKQALEESMTRILTEAKQYTDQEKSKYVPLAGNVSISNQIAMNAEPTSAKHIATKQYVDSINASMVEAENRRETAEGKREASEVKRATAESQRALAETERVSSEERRKEAETARVTAERARQTAEENRSQTFSNSLASWGQQVSAETTKANQATVEANKAVATANKASETANTAIGKMNETLERVPIVAENILTGTATGVIAHADDVYTSKALGFNIYGKSSQYTTTGANKFNPAGITNGSSNGLTWTKNENGSITVKGTSTALVNISLVANPSEFILSTGKWTGSVIGANKAKLIVQTLDGTQICNTNTTATRENKTEQGLKYLLLQVQAQTTLDETLFVYLEKSDKALYEEYTGGKLTPRPDYPREITNIKSADIGMCGKNLCEEYNLPNINWAQTLPKAVHLLNRMKGKSISITYTATLLSADDEAKIPNSNMGIIVKGKRRLPYTEQMPWGDGAKIGTTKTIVYSFTVPPDDEITNVWAYGCGNSSDSPDRTNGRADVSIQIELSTNATEYEPYHESNLPINLQGNELCSLPDGVRDEVRIDKDGNVELVKRTWKLQKRIGDMNNMEDYPGWVIPFSEMTCPLKSGYDAQITGFNTHFYRFYGKYIESQTEWLVYTVDVGMTQSELITQYPDEVVTFIGELHEPIITSLGKIDMPILPAPVCNAWANDENPTNVKFSYIRDVNIAYEKLASAFANAMNTPITILELEL